MSGICGYFGTAESPERRRRTIQAMAQALHADGRGEVHTALGQRSALAVSRTQGFADVVHEDGVLVAIAGSVRFEDDALAACARSDGMAKAVASGYRRSGTELLPKLAGHFEIAIIDERVERCWVGADRIGVHAPRYALVPSGFVFGSSAAALRRHPALDDAIDAQALYDYVYFHVIAGPRTVFRNIKRVMPGECVSFRDNACESRRYWQMRFDEHAGGSFEDLKQQFLASLRRGVQHAADGGSVGAFLSGGTDSSTVAGLLGEVLGEPARTYSIGFDAAGYDEIEYARIAARHFNTRHREYYVTADDIVATAPAIAAAHDQPFGNSSAVPAFYCADMARQDGVTRLLAGDGGDELFGGNERYAKQYVFSLYEQLPGWLRSGLLPRLLDGPATAPVALLRKAKSYVDQASVPMPDRLQTYNLLERLGTQRIFSADFLAQIRTEAPLDHLRDLYRQTNAHSLINRMLALDLQITLADNDLPKVTGSCELAGVEVAFPLLDDDVVEFSARLAPDMKLKGTRLRYFFKEALRGFLPDATIAKKKHGFGLPFGPWLQTNLKLRALANDSLSDIRKRNIFDPTFLHELTDRRVSEHAGYYGSLVWVVMMMELWFKTQHDSLGLGANPRDFGAPGRNAASDTMPKGSSASLESLRT